MNNTKNTKETLEGCLGAAKLRVFVGGTMILAGFGAIGMTAASVGESFSRGDKLGAAVKTAIAIGGMYTAMKGSGKVESGTLDARDYKRELKYIENKNTYQI
jgi:hypothetical protein